MMTLAPIDKCPCLKHDCKNQDDYTKMEDTCEECFMDCVEIDEDNE
jgi:hypothetical protein